jgi:SHS2 domain-containing protein
VADVVLVAWGATLAWAFESGAQGLLDLMVNTTDVTATTPVEVSCEANDVGAPFATFLNEILRPQRLIPRAP